MSVDRTLHVKSGVSTNRSVLKRPERIKIMRENEDFEPGVTSPLGLPKTRVKSMVKAAGKPKKEEKTAEAAADESGKAPAAE